MHSLPPSSLLPPYQNFLTFIRLVYWMDTLWMWTPLTFAHTLLVWFGCFFWLVLLFMLFGLVSSSLLLLTFVFYYNNFCLPPHTPHLVPQHAVFPTTLPLLPVAFWLGLARAPFTFLPLPHPLQFAAFHWFFCASHTFLLVYHPPPPHFTYAVLLPTVYIAFVCPSFIPARRFTGPDAFKFSGGRLVGS